MESSDTQFIQITIVSDEGQRYFEEYELEFDHIEDLNELAASICDISSSEFYIPLTNEVQRACICLKKFVVETGMDEDGPYSYSYEIDSIEFDRFLPSL